MNEQEAYENWSIAYETIHPKPEYPKQFDFSQIGLIFKIKVITTISLMLLVALRTGSQFYLAAASSTGVGLGWIEAGLAILGIEGLLLALAYERGRRRKALSEWQEMAGILLLIAISVMAGLSQSISVIDVLNQQIYQWITWGLGISLTLASVAAYLGGEMIGQQIGDIDGQYERNVEEYKRELEGYGQHKNAAWDASDERKVIRKDIRIEANIAQEEVRSSRNVQLNKVERSTGTRFEQVEQKSKSQEVYEWLDANFQQFNWIEVKQVPSAREIVSIFASYEQPINPSSAQNGRDRWIRDNNFNGRQ
jgi:hypothetical protein